MTIESAVVYKTNNYQVEVCRMDDESGVTRDMYFLDLADEAGSVKNLTSSTDKDAIIALANQMQGLEEAIAA